MDIVGNNMKSKDCDTRIRDQLVRFIQTFTTLNRLTEKTSHDRRVLKTLKETKWNPNNPKTGGPKLLKIAVKTDNVYLFNKLLELGFNLKAAKGILNLVCECESIIIFDRLMKVNMAFNTKNKIGRTPLFSACLAGNYYMAKTLLGKGAFINSWHEAGTPLHAACTFGNIYLVCLLLKRGAIIDIRNSLGETALHLACKLGKLGIVKLLLYFKAGLNVINITAQSPLDLAIVNGHMEIANVLISKGAIINYSLQASNLIEPRDENKRRMSHNKTTAKTTAYKSNPTSHWRISSFFPKKSNNNLKLEDEEARQNIEMIAYYMYQK